MYSIRPCKPALLALLMSAGLAALWPAQPAQADACAINWNTDSSGNFNVAGNWDQNRVPTGADKACINRPVGNPEVTIPAGYTATLAALTNRDGLLRIDGALVITGSDSILANLTVIDRCSGLLRVDAGGGLALEGDAADLTWSNYCPTATLVVNGALNKTGGGISTFAATSIYVQGGTLNATEGTLAMWSGSLVSATLSAGISGTLSIGGYVPMSGTLTGSGAGRVEVDAYLVATGTRAILDFPSGLFRWTGGYIDGRYAPITNTGFLKHPSGSSFVCGDVRNSGTLDVEAPLAFDLQTANLSNLASGTINLRGDSGDLGWQNGCYDAWPTSQGVGIVRNYGTLNKLDGGESIVVNVQVNTVGGIVHVVSGTLRPGNQPHLFENANIVIDAGAQINADATLGGAYSVLAMSGTVTGTGAGQFVLAQRLQAVGDGARLNFAPGWQTTSNSAQLDGYSAPITNVGQINLPWNESMAICGTFDNLGVINIRGTWNQDLRRTRLNNAPTGVINLIHDGGASSAGIFNWGNCASSISENDGARVVNRGRIIKTGSGASRITNNTLDVIGGSVEVLSGTLGGDGLSNFNSVYQNASIHVAPSATLAHCYPTQVEGLLTATGGGLVRVVELRGYGAGGDVDMPPGMLVMQSNACAGYTSTGINGVDAPLNIRGAIQNEPSGDLNVYGSVSASPGAQFRMTHQRSLVIRNGALFQATGSLTNRVMFVGVAPTPSIGQWRDIRVEAGGQAQLFGCVIRDGGNPGVNAAIYNPDSILSIEHCQLDGPGIGLYSANGGTSLRLNRFARGTEDNQVGNGSVIQLDARSNWWGHPSGPYHATLNPGGLGITVTGNVLFDPWLVIPPGDVIPDLRTGNVRAPANLTPNMPAALTFTVQNVGKGIPNNVTWQDLVYASYDDVFDLNDILVARLPHTGGLTSTEQYTTTAEITIPPEFEGRMRILVVADGRHTLPEANPRDNSDSVQTTLVIPELPLGGSVSGNLAGQVYKLTPNCAQAVRVSLTTSAVDAEVIARALIVPRVSTWDQAGRDFVIPRTCGVQFVRLVAAAPGAPFTLSAQALDDSAPLAIQAVSPTQSTGPATLREMLVTIKGSGFAPTSTVDARLPSGDPWPVGHSVPVSIGGVTYKDSQTLIARLRLPFGAFQPAGGETISITLAVSNTNVIVLASQTIVARANGSESCVLPLGGGLGNLRPQHEFYRGMLRGFSPNCIKPALPPLRLSLKVPADVRSGRDFPAVVTYLNDSGMDLPAQVLLLESENARYRFADERFSRGSRVMLFAINPDPDGPVDIIPNGAQGTIALIATPIIGGGHVGVPQTVSTLVAQPPPGAQPSSYSIDVDAMLRAFKPESMDELVWAALQLRVRYLGQTMTPSGFESALRALALELQANGVRTHDVMRLLQQEYSLADEYGEFSARHAVGAFGYGLPDVTVMRVITDVAGNRILLTGSAGQSFVWSASANAWIHPDDASTQITELAGEATLRTANGSSLRFGADGRLMRSQDASGNWLEIGYASGRPVSYTASGGEVIRIGYSGGRVVSITNAVGEVTQYGYDGVGDYVNAITTPAGTVLITRSLSADRLLRNAIERIRLADGNTIHFEYDALGRLARQNLNGALEPITYTRSGIMMTATNALGHAVSLQRASGEIAAFVRDPMGQTMNADYTQGGVLSKLTHSSGTVTRFDFDASGQLRRAVDSSGRGSTFSTDTRGRATGYGDAVGNITRFEYDTKDQLTRVTRADNTFELFEYGPSGLMITSTNRSGIATAFDYDPRNYITGTNRPGERMSIAYDARRNITQLVEIVAGVPKTTTLSYDSANRITGVVYPGGRQVLYTYDTGGRLETLGDGTGFLLRYSRLPGGRLAEIRDASNNLLVSYSYDAAGVLAREDRGNGTATGYATDAAGNVTQITLLGPGNVVQDNISYVYDASRRRVEMTTSAGITRYRYDVVGQLISTTLPGGRTLTWTYDLNGNRISTTDNGAPTAYAANEMNQYTTVGGTPASYDGNGRLISHGATSYAWNSRGQLASMTAPGEIWSFEYDVFGNRNAATRNGVRTEYLVDMTRAGDVLVEYTAGGAVIARYAHGYGLVGRLATGGNAYYGFDGSGNAINLTDGSGAVANTYRYLPFGEVESATEAIPNPFQFGGREGMMRTGALTYARARYLNNGWGRFISEEPAKRMVLNAYGYAHNNPVTYLDANGYEDAATTQVKNGFFDLGIGQSVVESGLFALDKVNDAAHLGFEGIKGYGIYAGAVGEQALRGSLAREALRRGHDAVGPLLKVSDKAAQNVSSLLAQHRANSRTLARFAEPVRVLGAGLTVGESLNNVSGALGRYMGDPSDENDALLKQEGFKGIAKVLLFEVPFAGTAIDKFVAAGDDVMRRGGGNTAIAGLVAWYYTPSDPFGPATRNPGPHTHDPDQRTADDPNEMVGPTGSDVQGWVPQDRYVYVIRFENVPTATANAALVLITHSLDLDLDPLSVELLGYGFGEVNTTFAEPRISIDELVDVSEQFSVTVRITATLGANELLQWRFNSLDPATGVEPADSLLGFLPPNNAANDGQGYVMFSVRSRAAALTGAQFRQSARIYFDDNAPIDTNTHVNTLDSDAPTCLVNTLPATTTVPAFGVSWAGNDIGSGIHAYYVFTASTMPTATFIPQWTLWQDEVAAMTGPFTGTNGNVYSYLCFAIDEAGNSSAVPVRAQTATLVSLSARRAMLPIVRR